MQKNALVAFLTIAIVLLGCSRVPISNRYQLRLQPEREMIAMGLSAYSDFISQNPPVEKSDPRAQMVERVGQRISRSVELFLTEIREETRFAGFNWEFNLVDDPAVNAWCMPGGKVVVYSGILPLTQDEAGLAVVMGHEIAHAIASHGNERMSQQLMVQFGGLAIDLALIESRQLTHDLFMIAYGVGSNMGILAYSRQHEKEADKMGLVFMAMAGYDPREAPVFWTRMSELSQGQSSDLFSTHPSDEKRILDLEIFMDEALTYYYP